MSSYTSYDPVFTQQELDELGPDVIFEKARRRVRGPVYSLRDAIFIINYDLKDPLVLRGAAKSGCMTALIYMLDTLSIPLPVLNYSFAIACGHGQLSAARVLLEYGADPYANGENAYRWALLRDKTEILSFLESL